MHLNSCLLITRSGHSFRKFMRLEFSSGCHQSESLIQPWRSDVEMAMEPESSKSFFSKKNFATDFDEWRIQWAKQRNTDKSIFYHIMDASKLKFDDNSFDAIFDFGIIHHIPNWKDCIQELGRVLKPGDEFYWRTSLLKASQDCPEGFGKWF